MSHGLIFNRGAPSPLLAACAQIAFRPDRMPVTAEVRQLRSSCGEPIASSASRTVSMSPCWSRPYRAINRIASRAASSLDFAVAEATSAPLASHRVRSNESVARCAISRGFVYAGMSVRPLAQLIFDHSNSRPHYVAFGAAVRVMLAVVTAGEPDAIIIGESADKLQEGVGFRRRKVKRDGNGARIRFSLGLGSTPWLRLGSSGCFSRSPPTRYRSSDAQRWRGLARVHDGGIVMKKLLLFATIAGCLVTLVAAARARSAYDGSWDLVFVTQRGTCDPTYNFSVNISNGIVTHPNLVKFRGFVARSGAVRASVTVQDKYASGSGRLSGASGRGTWSGHSGGGRCSGYWTAQRN